MPFWFLLNKAALVYSQRSELCSLKKLNKTSLLTAAIIQKHTTQPRSLSAAFTFRSSAVSKHKQQLVVRPFDSGIIYTLSLCVLSVLRFTWVGEVQRPILAIHPSEGRALTVSWPAERRPMSLSGSLQPGQAEAGWEEKQGRCYWIVLCAGATGPAVRAHNTQG